MIIVLTYKDKKTGIERVSHGVCTLTDRVIIMPDQPVTTTGAKWNVDLQEWVMYEKEV